jgi:hypothetical protein
VRVVGEIAHVVNGEWCRPHVRAETLLEHAGGLLLGEVEDQIRSREETRRVASKDRLMDEIVGDHRFARPVRRDDDHIFALREEVEGQDAFDGRPMNVGGHAHSKSAISLNRPRRAGVQASFDPLA